MLCVVYSFIVKCIFYLMLYQTSHVNQIPHSVDARVERRCTHMHAQQPQNRNDITAKSGSYTMYISA